MPHQSTKTFGHDIGLSCAFRQWRADSHCKYLHGYALSIKFVFEADELDDKKWVVDFGSMKTLRAQIENMLDHKTVVAKDDPLLDTFIAIDKAGLIQLVVVEDVGCEAFAEKLFALATYWLVAAGYGNRVRLVSCEVSEHGANSALYVA